MKQYPPFDPEPNAKVHAVLIVLIITLAMMVFCSKVEGTILCEDCPAPGSLGCVLAPAACEACWDECVDELPRHRRAGRRVGPPAAPIDPNVRSYAIDRAIGAQQLAYDINWELWGNDIQHPHARWTTKELLDDMASYGLNAVKIWFKGDPFDGTGSWCWSPHHWDREEPFSCAFGQYGFEDMREVWEHPDIDVYTIRFINTCWAVQEHNARTFNEEPKLSGRTFANEPTFDIAFTLLQRFGHLNKVVFFSDWETDWHARGQNSRGYDDEGNMRFAWDDAPTWYRTGCIEEFDYQTCGEMVTAARWEYVLQVVQRRQREIEEARAMFPQSQLRVFHSLIVNRYPSNFDDTDLGYHLVEHIKKLKDRPDFISISFWDRRTPIREALEWIMRRTGYTGQRILIDELGEWREQYQYDRIWNEGRQALCLGVPVINVWTWKQTWCSTTRSGATKSHSLFAQLNCPKPSEDPQQPVQFGTPRPGLQAVQDLLALPIHIGGCDEILQLPPTLE